MLIGQAPYIFSMLVEIVFKRPVGYVYLTFILRKFYINPAGSATGIVVFNYLSVYRVFERIIAVTFIVLVFLFRKIYPEISPWFWQIFLFACSERQENNKKDQAACY